MRILGWVLAAAVAFSAVGCVAYRAQPLEPEAELAALGRRSLEGFVVEFAKPGQGRVADPEKQAFDLSQGLGEDELIAVALTLSPELRAKRLEIGEAQAFLIAAGHWPNPVISLGYRPGLGAARGYSAEANLLVELLRPWERSARKEAATARVDEVTAGIVAEEWKVVREARTGRLAILVQEQTLAVLDGEIALRESTLKLAQRRREVGEGTELDISLAELELAEIRRDRRRSDTELGSAKRELNRVLGLPPDYALKLSDSGKPIAITVFDDVPDAEVDRRLLAGRFELRAKEAAYRKAEHELQLAVYRQFPALFIGPSASREPESGKYLGAALSLELPLFNRNQAEIAEKENLRERTRAEYAALLHRLKAEAFEARGQLRSARQEIEAQEKEILPLIRRNQTLFEAAYRAKELSVLDWVTAERRAVGARRTYLETLARYRTALVGFETATGMPLSQAAGAPPKKNE